MPPSTSCPLLEYSCSIVRVGHLASNYVSHLTKILPIPPAWQMQSVDRSKGLPSAAPKTIQSHISPIDRLDVGGHVPRTASTRQSSVREILRMKRIEWPHINSFQAFRCSLSAGMALTWSILSGYRITSTFICRLKQWDSGLTSHGRVGAERDTERE